MDYNYALNYSDTYELLNFSFDSNYTGFSSEEKLIFQEEMVLPYYFQALFICMFSGSAIVAIIGNILVIMVLLIRKRMTKGVRFSLVNLAMADLLIAVFCIPFTCARFIYSSWKYSTFMCTLVLFVQDVVQIVSVLTLTLMGLDRYFAILFPFKFVWLRSDKTVTIGVILTWLVAIAQCTAILVFAHTETYTIFGLTVHICAYMWPSVYVELSYAFTNFANSFAVPLAILIFAYSSIGWKLYNHKPPGNADAERDMQQHRNMIKVIKMLVLIVVIFTLCWSPVKMFIMVSWLNKSMMNSMPPQTVRMIYLVLYWVSMSNCFVNPIIYSFSNDDFSTDIKFIFRSIFYILTNRRKKLRNQKSSSSIKPTKASTNSQLPLKSIH